MVVAQLVERSLLTLPRDPRFESSHRQFYLLPTVFKMYWKDENKGKRGRERAIKIFEKVYTKIDTFSSQYTRDDFSTIAATKNLAVPFRIKTTNPTTPTQRMPDLTKESDQIFYSSWNVQLQIWERFFEFMIINLWQRRIIKYANLFDNIKPKFWLPKLKN